MVIRIFEKNTDSIALRNESILMSESYMKHARAQDKARKRLAAIEAAQDMAEEHAAQRAVQRNRARCLVALCVLMLVAAIAWAATALTVPIVLTGIFVGYILLVHVFESSHSKQERWHQTTAEDVSAYRGRMLEEA